MFILDIKYLEYFFLLNNILLKQKKLILHILGSMIIYLIFLLYNIYILLYILKIFKYIF